MDIYINTPKRELVIIVLIIDKIDLDFDLSINYQCNKCKKKGDVRVDVVWFGEQPKYLDLIYEYLEKTDIFSRTKTVYNYVVYMCRTCEKKIKFCIHREKQFL